MRSDLRGWFLEIWTSKQLLDLSDEIWLWHEGFPMVFSTNFYVTNFYRETAALAKSIVIKFDEHAKLMNESIVERFGYEGYDPYDPTNWVYYNNLAGKYHYTQEVMRVISVDTLQEIDFTVANLHLHQATHEFYQPGSNYYKKLLLRYPENEFLINGILNPIDMDYAIEAENGKIINYKSDLVQENEETLISDLEKWIKNQLLRWHNIQFVTTDNLYMPAIMTILAGHIFPKLLNLRAERAKTNEVHDFHVLMYLASHNSLDHYVPYLTQRQKMWLYRNILYVERNSGKCYVFDKLVEKLLTERAIPLTGFDIYSTKEFNDYRTIPTTKIIPLNEWAVADRDDDITIDHLLQKEIPEAPDNQKWYDDQKAEIIERFSYNPSEFERTKLLESSAIDYSDAVPEKFKEVMLREWINLSQRGMYDVLVYFKDPNSGIDRALFAKDAFIYFYYLSMFADGYTFSTIPQYLNMRERRIPRPTVDDLLAVTDDYFKLGWAADLIVSRQPQPIPVYSTQEFYEHAIKIYDEAIWQWYFTAAFQDHYERAQVENMCNMLYEDIRLELSSTIATRDIQTWLLELGLPKDYTYSRAQAFELMNAIYEAATGIKLNKQDSLKFIQAAMINLFKQLSSYSIHFTYDTIDDSLVLIDWPAARAGNIRGEIEDLKYIPIVIDIIEAQTTYYHRIFMYLIAALRAGTEYIRNISILFKEPDLRAQMETEVQIYNPSLSASITYPGQDDELDNRMMLPGYTTFNNLSEEQKLKLANHFLETT
jgi:hypothetical protein